jgi:hypothetical protein
MKSSTVEFEESEMRGHTIDTIDTVGYDYKKLLYTGTCAPPT